MDTFGTCYRHCLRRSAPLAAVSALLAWTSAGLADSPSPWLDLGVLAVPWAAVATAVTLWPAFATDGSARDLVCRAGGGPLRGLRAAVLAGVAAAATGLLLLWIAVSPLVPAPRAHTGLVANGRPGLDAEHPTLEFALGSACDEVRFRPIVLMSQDELQATRVAFEVDGEPVADGEVEFTGDRQLVRLPMHGRSAARVTLRRISGTLRLWFDEGAAIAIAAAPSSRVGACALAALVTSLPALVTLALLAALAPFLRTASALVVATCALLVQTLGRVGPAEAALAACTRGRRLLDEALFWPCLASLALGLLAMIAVMATHAQRTPGHAERER